MLVLTRKKSESIRIADEIEVVVLAVQGRRVRLGISCPREIPVHRHELQQQGGNSRTPTTQESNNRCKSVFSN